MTSQPRVHRGFVNDVRKGASELLVQLVDPLWKGMFVFFRPGWLEGLKNSNFFCGKDGRN